LLSFLLLFIGINKSSSSFDQKFALFCGIRSRMAPHNSKCRMPPADREYLSVRTRNKGRYEAVQRMSSKIAWSAEEDAALMELRSFGLGWATIAKELNNQRSAKICRNRWVYTLDPSINRGAWSAEEDAALRLLYVQFSGKFAAIARNLPGRTDNACRNRFCCIEPHQARAANLLNRRCMHNMPARRCKKCNGCDICEHRVTRNWCSICKGSLVIRLQIKNRLADIISYRL
jgi:hypothetical protein